MAWKKTALNSRSQRCVPRAIGLLLIAVWSSGCDSKSGGGTVAVTGKVTLENKPVAGNVVFVAADKKEFSALIDKDGKYTVADMPAGEYKVAIRGFTTVPKNANRPKNLPGLPPEATSAESGAAPPEKYADANRSGLAFNRASGKQEFDIVLTP